MTSAYRILVEHDPDPDMSWLEQDQFASENPADHAALGMILETLCSCCGSWNHGASVWGIDVLVTDDWETGTFSSLAEISHAYLREVASDLLSEVSR